jgi:putative Mg2+ transporter-C (MgtC) family protein
MTVNWWRLLDILIAYALAFPLGIERERSEHTAGIRTFPLVSIATCAFLMASIALKHDYADVASRVLQGVVAGIGFVGGGAILKTGNTVIGTATAAGLWATAAIGACVAFHNYDIAIGKMNRSRLHAKCHRAWRPVGRRGERESCRSPFRKLQHRCPLSGRP